ncbi:placenta-expressed transcript 1 protein-like [Stegostoma tigrinum]|uniref:placenta-expressed transcript 1 protein-like n=1 Tax=Stegostoma tigrinum TaxID=3053191 RepID=UPI00202AF956|nr:placenta-expressed transcript 1 protein-like [Stegostoma tigrinum]
MASVLSALLLCLFLQYAASDLHNLCMIENATMGGSFSLMIYPKYLMPNTTYRVTVNGTGAMVMVALSASYNGSSVGTWTNDAENCAGVYGSKNLSFTEKWMSPKSMMNMHSYVLFKAFVKMSENMTYVMNKTLRMAPTMTAMPITQTTAAYNKTTTVYMSTTPYNMTTTPYNMTTTPYNMTTNFKTTTTSTGAIIFKPLSGIISMSLLFVTVRELLS